MSCFHHLFGGSHICFCVKQSDWTKIHQAEPSGDVVLFGDKCKHMCAELLRYFDIFKQVYLLGFVTGNESALFYLFNLSDPCFVNRYLIPWLTLNFFLKFDLILFHVSEYSP